MKKLVKNIHEITKQCGQVAVGTNTEFYLSQGFVEEEVELAFDNTYYIVGFAPTKPQELTNQERIDELKVYISSTDWYVIRHIENGVEIPVEIALKRQEARLEISQLREDLENVN